MSRTQTFVRLPTEFDNLLLNAAGYFDVSPKVNAVFLISNSNSSAI